MLFFICLYDDGDGDGDGEMWYIYGIGTEICRGSERSDNHI